MSHKKKKNYYLFKLVPVKFVNDCEVNGEWQLQAKYTYGQLLNKLTSNEVHYVRDTDRIKTHLSKNVDDTRLEYTRSSMSTGNYILFRYNDLVSVRYVAKYMIVKEKDGELYKVDYESLYNDVNKLIEKYRGPSRVSQAYNSRSKAEVNYVYRYDPVPCLYGKREHVGAWYRHPKLQRTRIQESSAEYKEFRKPKRCLAALPVWDDRPRHNDKSWKTSCKVRKQWQKHTVKHMDTDEFNKRAYLDELDRLSFNE